MDYDKNYKENPKRNKLLFLVSIVFGISSWVVFSGVWVEAPLLVHRLPEAWKVPSMIGAVSVFAQFGPLLLLILKCKCISCFENSNRFTRFVSKYEVSDRAIIYGLFAIGLVSGACLAMYWDKTALINGQMRSWAFFSCVFCLAILDCTCTIVFLTYIGEFKGNYITGLYIGEGISSLLPSVFALLQGTDDDTKECINNSTLTFNSTQNLPDLIEPRFSITVYFWLLFSTLVISFLAFLMLEFWPSFLKEKIKYSQQRYFYEDDDHNFKIPSRYSTEHYTLHRFNVYLLSENELRNKKIDKNVLLFCITLVSFVLYGFIPGLSSYSTLPYGNHIMHLAVTLSLITQPLSSLLATFVQLKSTKQILILLMITVTISGYIFLASCLSPCPPFVNTWFGGYLMILSWIFSFGLLMYLRCCITTRLKDKHTEKSLVWCGVLTQLGQLIGSILTYILVDIAQIFKEVDPCIKNQC